MKPASLLRAWTPFAAIALFAFNSFLVEQPLLAANITWFPTTNGTFSWNTSASWGTGSGPIPTNVDTGTATNSTGATVTQTINLNTDTAVGGFQLGTAGSTYNVTISGGTNPGAFTLTLGSATTNTGLTVATKTNLTIDANVALGSGITSVPLSTAGIGTITFGSGYTVSAPLTETGASSVNLNSDFNTGAATTAFAVNQGILNWNVGTFTSSSTAANVLIVSSTGANKPSTINFLKSYHSNGGITLSGGSGTQGSVINLYGTANGVTIGDNIVTTAGTGNPGVNANTITLGANDTTATLATPSTITFSGNYTIVESATFARTSQFFAAANNTAEFSGVISGGTAATTILQKTGAGTVILDGSSANTYTSSTPLEVVAGTLVLQKTAGVNAVNGGVKVDSTATLKLGASNQILDSASLTLNGGTFDANTFNETMGTLTGASGTVTNSGAMASTLTLSSGAQSYSGLISDGTGGINLVISGSGVNQTLGGANTFTGTTSLASGGSVTLTNQNALQDSTLSTGASGNHVIFDSSVTGHAFTLGGLSGATDITLADNAVTPNAVALSVGNNNSSPAAYSGVLSGAGSFIKIGSGTTTLSGLDTYHGGTTVNAGALLVANTDSTGTNSATGDGALTVAGGTTFGGSGSSIGSRFDVGTTGTGTATIQVGSGGIDTTSKLTLKGTTSTVTPNNLANVNLAYNLSTATPVTVGPNGVLTGAGNVLDVGNSTVAFSTGVGTVKLTLNLQGGNIVEPNTPYVLIAGNVGVNNGTSQYTGLTFGNISGTLATGQTSIINSSNFALDFGALNGFYQSNSYLFLYQNTATGVDDIEVEVVPEPGIWALMLGGLALLIFWQRRRSFVV